MDARDAARLIEPAVTVGSVWADLGAGRGTFTMALAGLLGPRGHVYAVEREPRALAALHALIQGTHGDRARISVLPGDFTAPLALPALDGVLLANSLHFVPDEQQAPLLAHLMLAVPAKGPILIVEYDSRPRSRWVPFPVSLMRLETLSRDAGLTSPVLLGRRESEYGGTMYAARLERALT
jgi:SAM-dependent methyltransferase